MTRGIKLVTFGLGFSTLALLARTVYRTVSVSDLMFKSKPPELNVDFPLSYSSAQALRATSITVKFCLVRMLS